MISYRLIPLSHTHGWASSCNRHTNRAEDGEGDTKNTDQPPSKSPLLRGLEVKSGVTATQNPDWARKITEPDGWHDPVCSAGGSRQEYPGTVASRGTAPPGEGRGVCIHVTACCRIRHLPLPRDCGCRFGGSIGEQLGTEQSTCNYSVLLVECNYRQLPCSVPLPAPAPTVPGAAVICNPNKRMSVSLSVILSV